MRRRDLLSLEQYLDELEKLDAATAAPSSAGAATDLTTDHAADRSGRAARHAALSLATAVMVTRRKGGKATLTWLMRTGGRGSRLFCVFGVAHKRKHRYPVSVGLN